MKNNTKEIKELVKSVIEDVINNVEAGEWINPVKAAYRMPFFNPVSKSVYSGNNIFRLKMYCNIFGFTDPRFMTFAQAKEKGFRIKKGAKSCTLLKFGARKEEEEITPVDLFADCSEEDEKTEEKPRAFVRKFNVFNAADIIGISPLDESFEYSEKEKNELLENMIKNSESEIKYDGAAMGGNCYDHTWDIVHLYERKAFINQKEFYVTAAHEIAHSTGAEMRLNRPHGHFSEVKTNKRERKLYAREELVAELTAAMIREEFGGETSPDHLKNQRVYLSGWAQILKDDTEEIAKVYRDALKAAEYIKERMIYKNSSVKSYEERIKDLPDIPDVQKKEDEKKAPKKSAVKKEKPEPVAALALPKTIKREITLGRKKKEKKFSVIVRKKDDGDYIPF